MSIASKMVDDAWKRFDRWCKKHDPDGDLDPVQQVDAYSKWCDDQKRLATLPRDLQ